MLNKKKITTLLNRNLNNKAKTMHIHKKAIKEQKKKRN